jgi:nucleotide-binding universal stress UspA family protein
MFERLLVPIDASAESLLALPLACQLAEATGARLCLLRIALAYDLAPAGSGGDEPAARRIAEGAICPGDFPPAEEVILRAERASDIPAAIVAEARARRADLIVMATHARSGLERLTHPSVAEAVLASAPVPLLLINATFGRLADGAAAPVLVAVDGTPEGAAALPVAVRYARALDAEILLLRVVAPQFTKEGAADLRYDLAALDDAQHYLDRLAAQVNDCGVSAQGRALFGPVAETIATVAEQVNAGAIVLGTNGLRGVARLVRGSVADDVLRAGSCPIMLVRRDGPRSPDRVDAARDAPGARQPIAADVTLG